MKAYQSLKYLLCAGALGFWGCSSQQLTQSTEYDDLYFSSKDREQATLTASASSKDYSDVENKGEVNEDNSQKNVNPEYIQQYADQGRKKPSSNNDTYSTNGDGYNNNDSYSADNNSYYDENYSRNNRPIDLARDYNRYNSGTNINVFPGIGYGGMYSSGAFYDPFYDPFYSNSFYDPFYRPFYGRPGWNVSISYNYGWGNSWGWGRPHYGSYWNDPFYSPYRSWGYDPYYSGFYNQGYYGYNRWNRGGNVIIVNPSNGNSNDSRQVRYSPRSGRSSGVVNNDFDNTPRTNRSGRDGRIDNSADAGTNPSTNYSNDNNGRRPANISSDENRPARAVRPRSNANPDYQPQTTQPEYNNSGRYSSPNVNSNNSNSGSNNNGSVTNPRAVRPRSNGSQDNNYYENNANRSSAPTYNSTPSTGRSQRSYESSPRSNNDSWNNSGNSNNTYRSSGGSNNSNSSGTYSSPSPSSSPRGGSNSSSGSSSPRRSPR